MSICKNNIFPVGGASSHTYKHIYIIYMIPMTYMIPMKTNVMHVLLLKVRHMPCDDTLKNLCCICNDLKSNMLHAMLLEIVYTARANAHAMLLEAIKN